MSDNVRVRVGFIDDASRGMARLEQQTLAIQRRIAEGARRTAQESTQAVRTEQDAHIRAYQQINEARERLNVRAHSQIREEITHTQAAYRTLAASGTLSFREQAQAAERMRTTVRQLTNEMGHLTAAQHRYNAVRLGAGAVGAVGGGVIGAGLMMRAPVTNAIELERHLADISNTAFPEYDTKGRLMGIKRLAEVVHKTVRDSGIKLDGAVTILDAMTASGMDIEKVIDNLSLAATTVVANRADPAMVASSISKLYSTHIVSNDAESRTAQNMMVGAGQAGSNEYRDLVKALPEQLAEGSSSGLVGLKGLRRILIMDEASMLTAGTPDQANINVKNLLSKLNSHDTAKHFEKMGRGDLSKYLMLRATQGADSVEALVDVIKDELKRDKNLKQAISKLNKSKKGDKEGIVESLNNIGIGKVISALVPDLQARGSLYSLLNDEVVNKITANIDRNRVPYNGANERNYEVIRETSSFKIDRGMNNIDESQKKLLDENVTPNINKAADKVNGWTENHPTASKYLSAVPWALGAIGGSSFGMGMMGGLAARYAPSIIGAVRPGIVANTGVAISRAAELFSATSTRISALLARSPALTAASTRFAPYMPTAGSLFALPSLMYAGQQASSLLNSSADRAISALHDKETTLGDAIRELISHKPEPVEVTTKSELTVKLAPGLVPIGQSSNSTSTSPKGKNSSILFSGGNGNIWSDAP